MQELARDNAEARLFWSFLDESFGMDFLTFYLYCLNLAETVCGMSLRRQWGPHVPNGNNHERLESALNMESVFSGTYRPADRPSDQSHDVLQEYGGQETVWIGLRQVRVATDIILTKTSKVSGEVEGDKLIIDDIAQTLAFVSGCCIPQEQQTKMWENIRSLAVVSEDRLPVIPNQPKDEECVDLHLWLR